MKPPSIHLSCGLLEFCHPAGSLLGGTKKRRTLACTRTIVKFGTHLYKSDAPLRSIYSIMTGTLKTFAVAKTGEERVIGFHMRGAILGLDAMEAGHYTASAIALEDSQVCIVPTEYLGQHCQQGKSVAQRIHVAMAREMNIRQRMVFMLGGKTAEQRVASFLIDLAATYFALGYSSSDINLVMSRAEIGSYLGLTFETVSRIMSSFQNRRLLAVNRKHIRILDIEGLKRTKG